MSATVQYITKKHKEIYGTLDNFHEKNVIQINDTHPALVIPELLRILLDEERMDFDKAFSIVTGSVAYTNHTVMPEALEKWPIGLLELLLPRIASIIHELKRALLPGVLGALQRRF